MIGSEGVRNRKILMVHVCVILSLGMILWLVLRGLGRALGVSAWLCVAVLRFVRLCGSFEDAARVLDVFLSHLKCSGASWV